MPVVEVTKFRKVYDGKVAVDDMSFTVEAGDVFGLIGPNGAGKTTTIRFLATLLEPTRGTARIDGHSVMTAVREVRKRIGYLPDHFGVYDGMRVWEFLDFFALAYGIPLKRREKIIQDVLTLVDLGHKRDDLVNGLSRGTRQRLGLAKTLLHDPPVLILDEPASGLDPRARVEIKALLRELKLMGKTILISSHILSDLADLCNRVAIIEGGKLLACAPVEEIIGRFRERHVIEASVLAREKELANRLAGTKRVANLEQVDGQVRFDFAGGPESIAALHADLIREGYPLLWFREVEVTLEEAFFRITKGEVS